MQPQEHILLKDFTTFRIGGPARYFVAVKNTEELREAIQFAHSKQLPIFVLGGGSNVLISDKGFPGLVIKIEIKGIEYKEREGEDVEVIVGAGENWDDAVGHIVSRGLSGLENLSLIPGSVGAAPVQNIGAYGAEVKDTISWVEVFNTETYTLEQCSKEQCQFDYRDSIFKKPEGKKYVITRVGFKLSKKPNVNITYKDISNYISEHKVEDLSIQKIRDIVIEIRTKKLPNLKEYGTAGSFFKNPVVLKEQYDELVKKYSGLPGFTGASHGDVKIPAAWILDTLCNFKGYRDGDAGVYKNQALVLVNFGSATAEDISSLSEKMIACVKEKTSITLEKEVQIIF
ncbi:UDP-N-acetylmuramate dehydrogenase [Candidatus Parcubacteria bacterium]|nr:UDP-N-acetylmuramate dehydrogenase [Candidatus Parcubacteria bacterium]